MVEIEGACGLRGRNLIAGWVRPRTTPLSPVGIEIRSASGFQGFVTANLPQPTMGENFFGFRCELPLDILEDGLKVHVTVRGTNYELRNSPLTIDPGKSVMDRLQVTALNIKQVLATPLPLSVRYLLVDPIDTCNAHCLYCPSPRSNQKMELDDFALLLEKITPPELLQLGCGQEPTVDKRLGQFFEKIGACANKPTRLQMITNGTLLDRHDASVFVANGLNSLMLSIDTADAAINDRLREGTHLPKILANIKLFRQCFPAVKLSFSVVVTSETIDRIAELVELGEELGVSIYFFREVTDYATTPRDPRYWTEMPRLVLQPGQFDAMKARLLERWPAGNFRFLGRNFLDDVRRSTYQERRALLPDSTYPRTGERSC
jgi:sulfatase maturation enzyme AslB (radical SAM superfamily)